MLERRNEKKNDDENVGSSFREKKREIRWTSEMQSVNFEDRDIHISYVQQ